MNKYRRGDAALLPVNDSDAGRPDDDAVLLDVAANFASEHGVPEVGRPDDRERSLRQAARQWPLLEDPRQGESASEDEVVELLRDAVDARDRFPGLWAAATERGALGGRDLRQLVHQHRDKALTETLRIDADQVVVLRSEPDLWHAVFRASRFLGRLHAHGLTDEEILTLVDTHVQDPAIDLRAG
ncbi:MAG TPA: hypothetical protein VIT41_18180 [Microlunatus sp.]